MSLVSQARKNGDVWFPPGTQVLGEDREGHVLIVIYARSGVGKSHLVRQLLLDEEYGINEVLVLMSEDATTTYNVTGAHVKQVTSILEVDEQVRNIINAANIKKRLPKVIVWDSLSGTMDYQRRHYKENQPFQTEGGKRDVRAEFGDLGYSTMDTLAAVRDFVRTDVIVMVTTYEDPYNPRPEISVDGKLIPKHLTRLSTQSLYMKAERVTYDAAKQDAKPALHRTIGYDADTGKLSGEVINRFFITQDTGEVFAKGHHNLALKERAILPELLRKIHGLKQEEKDAK